MRYLSIFIFIPPVLRYNHMEGLKKKIAVIMGGVGSEHDVSMNSGTQILDQIDRERYTVVKVVINTDHTWEVDGVLCSFSGAIDELQALNIDLAFLALHGTGGEDGTIQGVLEYAGIPYTGSDVTASAVAMDKVLAKKIFQSQGMLVPPSVVVECHEWQTAVAEVERICGYPCVVKPLRDGSSVGVVMADDVFTLSQALRGSTYPHLLVEKKILGVEVTCGVLDVKGEMFPRALLPTQIIPKESSFFDYHAKYTAGASEEITPARLAEDVIAHIQEIAVQCHKGLGCKGMSRTDMMVATDGIYVLEINTIPGMTQTSLLPQQARVAGISFPQLITLIIENALEGYVSRYGPCGRDKGAAEY